MHIYVYISSPQSPPRDLGFKTAVGGSFCFVLHRIEPPTDDDSSCLLSVWRPFTSLHSPHMSSCGRDEASLHVRASVVGGRRKGGGLIFCLYFFTCEKNDLRQDACSRRDVSLVCCFLSATNLQSFNGHFVQHLSLTPSFFWKKKKKINLLGLNSVCLGFYFSIPVHIVVSWIITSSYFDKD